MANLSTSAVQSDQCAAQIQSVNVAAQPPTATGLTRQGTTITIDLRYAVGAVHVVPMPTEQWFCKRVGANWVLDRKLPKNTDTLGILADNPVPGLMQIGTSGAGDGPLWLDGSSIICDAPLQLTTGTNGSLPDPTTTAAGSLAYDGTEPVYCDGTAWSPMTGGTGYYTKPSGGIPATDLATAVQSDLTLAASALQTVPNSSVGTAQLSATGSPSATTFLSGLNTWASPAAAAGSTTPTASTLAEWDANVNLSSNAFLAQMTSTATAAGTTTLSITSDQIQQFTGTTTQTVLLPTTSVPAGAQYQIINNSTGAVTVQSSAADTIVILAGGTNAILTALSATPTTATSWDSLAPVQFSAAWNVPENYGAHGDGSTDDTTAMQAWLNAVYQNKGYGVLTPGKTYKITSALTLGTAGATTNYGGWTIDGLGATITQATNGDEIFAFVAEDFNNFVIRNLNFGYANQQSSSNSSTGAITFDATTTLGYGWWHGIFENLDFRGTCYRGIFLKEISGHEVSVWGCTFDNIRSEYGSTGSCIRLCGNGNVGMPANRFTAIYQERASCPSTEPMIRLTIQFSPVLSNLEVNESANGGPDVYIDYSSNVRIDQFRTEIGSNNANDGIFKFVQATGSVSNWEVSNRAYATNAGSVFDLSQSSKFDIGSGFISVYSVAMPGSNLAIVYLEDATCEVNWTGTPHGYNGSGTPIDIPGTSGILMYRLASGAKLINPWTTTITSSATPTFNTDATRLLLITGQTVPITSMTSGMTGNPVDGQELMIRITGTAARTIAWGTGFASSGSQTLLATTATTKTHVIQLYYDAVKAAWVCWYVDATGY